MRTLTILLLCLIALPLAAQEATIPAETERATKLVVKEIRIQRDCLCADVTVELLDTDGTVRRSRTYRISPETDDPGTLAGLVTAMDTARASETGTSPRRFNFRVLGYLLDQGYLPGGTVLVP